MTLKSLSGLIQRIVLWHQLSKNRSKEEKKPLDALCGSCKRLCTDLERQKRWSHISTARKVAQLQSSSHFKLKYLSPTTVAARKKATQMERSTDKAKLAKYKELELPLDDEQSDELCNVMKMIEETCPDELDKKEMIMLLVTFFVTLGK